MKYNAPQRENFATTRRKKVDQLILKLKHSGNNWKQKDVDKLLKLHEPLFKKACTRYDELDSKEVFRIAQEVFLFFVFKFDPDRGVYFNTFIRRAFWWALYVRLRVRVLPQIRADDAVFDIGQSLIPEYCEIVKKTFGEMDGDLCFLRISFGLSQRIIATLLNVSRCTVGSHWQKIKKFLQKKWQAE